MKKLLTMLLVFVFLFSIAASATNSDVSNQNTDKQQKRIAIVEKLQAKGNFQMEWNKEKDSPRFISGNLSEEPVADSDAASQYMETNKALFNLESGKFQVKNVNKDKLGMTHYKMQYTVDGIPVYGGEMILHTDKDGNVKVINGSVDTNVPEKEYSKQVKLSAEGAIKAAEDILGFTPDSKTYTAKPTAETFIYNANSEWQPVYLVTLQFVTPYPANMKVFVNAENGTVADHYNGVNYMEGTTGEGIGVLGDAKTLQLNYLDGYYYLQDLTKGAKILTYTTDSGIELPGKEVCDTDIKFDDKTQAAAVDAHYYAGVVYDYYLQNFERNSYNGDGADIISTVNYDKEYNNAFWNGSQMVFGDGDGITYQPFSAALDVVAHEFTHAVTENTVNLVYKDEPGAISESISDVFGYLIEGDAADWLIGENCSISGAPFRSLATPKEFGQPEIYDEYDPSGDPHINSGILNKAFYLAASELNDNKSMAQVWYRAITNYLVSESQFVDFRDACEQSAKDLFGPESLTLKVVSSAYDKVNIIRLITFDDYEPNNTISEATAIANGTTYQANISYSTDVDYYKFTTTAPGTISVSLTYLPRDFDMYLLDSAGNEIASSCHSSTYDESISYNAAAAGTFYVKIIGFNGTWSQGIRVYSLKATYPAGQWYYETVSLGSPHNYPDNYTGTNTYTKLGATQVKVHFTKIETEANYDTVYIKNKIGKTLAQYSGTLSGFWIIINGDTMDINLVTNGSITAYGYQIDQAAYFADSPL